MFAGPLRADADPDTGRPDSQEFWKIVAMRRTRPAELSITGYLLSQARLDQPIGEEARFVFGAFRTYQVPIATIRRARAWTSRARRPGTIRSGSRPKGARWVGASCGRDDIVF